MSKEIVIAQLGMADAKELWATGYRPALPVTPQDYTLGGVLPAVLYMMRWGHRRGKGNFFDTFGKNATVKDVAAKLASETDSLVGFEGTVEQSVLADLLLAYCLENKGHRTGRNEQVQRNFPTHYFSSWVDLPKDIANIRNVPEMIAAMLANQPVGATLTANQGNGYYVVGVGFERNALLSLFGYGTDIDEQRGGQDSLTSDRFDENTDVGIDQLLSIRLAQSLGSAPIKTRGENPNIPNQLPVATRAASIFYEDFNVFLRSYGRHIPRQSLLMMLESCLSIGLTNTFLSTLSVMLRWSFDGKVPEKNEQSSWGLFVDCSVSADMTLRRFSEECVDDLMQRLNQLPIILMCLRILAQQARHERLRALPAPEPDPTAHIDFLGALLNGDLDESDDVRSATRKICNKLADALEQEGEAEVQSILENEEQHPAWRLAEALVFMMGEKLQGAHFRKYLDSCLMIDQPNGIARKRRATIKGKSAERRSIVLTNTALDFLVHRHLRKAAAGTGATYLSLTGFIRKLREKYGFYVDESPPTFSIPDDQLRKNRDFLERRLRDLGLFVGVNDAEAMKRLQPRFEVTDDDQ